MNWLAEVARERYGCTVTTIIPNYVDTTLFRPVAQKKQQIVFAGRLHCSKGVDLLIEASRHFLEDHPEYKVIILGDGEEREKLETLANGCPRIVFKGNVDFADVSQYLNESEIFVLPTRTMEGHARALVEAMAAGCKCIVSDVPGNVDVLTESDSVSLMFRSGDAADLLGKLNYSRSYYSKNQLRFAQKNYSGEVLLSREIALLNTLFRGHTDG